MEGELQAPRSPAKKTPPGELEAPTPQPLHKISNTAAWGWQPPLHALRFNGFYVAFNYFLLVVLCKLYYFCNTHNFFEI